MSRVRPILFLLLASGSALAQTEGATPDTLPTIAVQELPQDAAPASTEGNVGTENLDAVVVTARRKKEAADVVPISMTVLSGEKLAEAGLYRPQDIQERIPNLVVSVPNTRLTSYTIRGLGSSSANDGLESSVGLYLDGVYLGRQGLSIFDLVDLERVEVLRGPQGTLFGKNTTAGVFNIVTKAPTQEFEAKADVSLGDFNYRQIRGSLNGGLTETISARVTGYTTQRDGMIDNLFDDRVFNDQNRQGVRGQLLFKPSEQLASRLIAEYGRTSELGSAFLLTVYRDVIRERDAYVEYQREPTDPFARKVQYDSKVAFDVRQKAVSNELTYSFGPGDNTTLTSITAYRDWNFVPFNDDATSIRIIPLTGVINDHKQVSQELRLATKFDAGTAGAFDLLGGLYTIQQDLDSNTRSVLGRDVIPWALGGILRQQTGLPLTRSNSGAVLDLVAPGNNVEGVTILTDAFQKSGSDAVFANVDWHVTPRFDATVGLRYTQEKKTASVRRRRTAPTTGGTVDFDDPNSFTQLPGAVLGAIGIPDPRNVTLNLVLDQLVGGDLDRSTRYKEGAVSGTFSLGYQLLPNLRTFATVSRGFKGGGINLGAIGPSVSETFEPELATNYEVGLKGRFFKRRAGLNVSLYNTEIRDYQALTFDSEPTIVANPLQVNILNVGKVRLQGIEIDSRARLFRFLNLRAAASYGRAVTLDFTNAPDENTRMANKDLSGQQLFNAPRFTGTAGIEVLLPLPLSLQGVTGIDYSYRSSYFNVVERAPGSETKAYGLTNLRFGVRTANELEAGLLVRNLFDEEYIAAINPLYGAGDYGAIVGDPRTVIFTVRSTFR